MSCSHTTHDSVFQQYTKTTTITTTTTTTNNNNNNNNNKGSRGMGEVAPLYGVDSALVLTNPGVQ